MQAFRRGILLDACCVHCRPRTPRGIAVWGGQGAYLHDAKAPAFRVILLKVVNVARNGRVAQGSKDLQARRLHGHRTGNSVHKRWVLIPPHLPLDEAAPILPSALPHLGLPLEHLQLLPVFERGQGQGLYRHLLPIWRGCLDIHERVPLSIPRESRDDNQVEQLFEPPLQ